MNFDSNSFDLQASRPEGFEGNFAVWLYTIGHGCLLLRRTKSEEYPTRIDILLKDVGWMSIPMSFRNIQIREVPREEVQGVLAIAGSPREAGRRVFALSGAGWRGYVLAATVGFHEDYGEYNDPSVLLEGMG